MADSIQIRKTNKSFNEVTRKFKIKFRSYYLEYIREQAERFVCQVLLRRNHLIWHVKIALSIKTTRCFYR